MVAMRYFFFVTKEKLGSAIASAILTEPLSETVFESKCFFLR